MIVVVIVDAIVDVTTTVIGNLMDAVDMEIVVVIIIMEVMVVIVDVEVL
jgi:hypothetical protein